MPILKHIIALHITTLLNQTKFITYTNTRNDDESAHLQVPMSIKPVANSATSLE